MLGRLCSIRSASVTRPEDARMADAINAYYANFALRGNPNGLVLPAWKPFTGDDQSVMNFTSDRGGT